MLPSPHLASRLVVAAPLAHRMLRPFDVRFSYIVAETPPAPVGFLPGAPHKPSRFAPPRPPIRTAFVGQRVSAPVVRFDAVCCLSILFGAVWSSRRELRHPRRGKHGVDVHAVIAR